MSRYHTSERRPRLWACIGFLLCLVVLSMMGQSKLGRPLLAAQEGTTPLRMMTWNAYFRNSNITALQDAIEAETPDVIAIQELGAPLADAIRTALQQDYPFQILHPSSIPAGLAVLSRYPLAEAHFDENRGCNCQIVTLRIAGQLVTLINTHPWPAKSFLTGGKLFEFDTTTQDRVFDQLLEQIKQTAGPLLLTGDLNTMPIQANYRRLRNLLHDAYVESGVGPATTFPISRTGDSWLTQPVIRIDYIFYNDAWQAQRSWVGSILGSDHRYVMAELALKQ